jgi:hypothetical protein
MLLPEIDKCFVINVVMIALNAMLRPECLAVKVLDAAGNEEVAKIGSAGNLPNGWPNLYPYLPCQILQRRKGAL